VSYLASHVIEIAFFPIFRHYLTHAHGYLAVRITLQHPIII